MDAFIKAFWTTFLHFFFKCICIKSASIVSFPLIYDIFMPFHLFYSSPIQHTPDFDELKGWSWRDGILMIETATKSCQITLIQKYGSLNCNAKFFPSLQIVQSTHNKVPAKHINNGFIHIKDIVSPIFTAKDLCEV